MSDIGVGLILFVGVLLLVGVLRFLAWLTELQNEHGSLGRAGINTVKRYVAPRSRVMSHEHPQARQTNQTDEPDGRVFEANPWSTRLGVDRTKTALIEVLVYSGWTVAEIRGLIKGDNGTLGIEIEAARKRLGIEAPAPHVTPIVGRPTSARFETDADYPYRPIEV